MLEQAQQLLDEGQSVPEVEAELQVLANTLHKAISAGRLRSSQESQALSARQPPRVNVARPTAKRRWGMARRVGWNEWRRRREN